MDLKSVSPAGGNGEARQESEKRPANTAPSPSTQVPARLVVRLELDASRAGLSYRRLRWLLKTLLRRHHLRCVSIGPDRGQP